MAFLSTRYSYTALSLSSSLRCMSLSRHRWVGMFSSTGSGQCADSIRHLEWRLTTGSVILQSHGGWATHLATLPPCYFTPKWAIPLYGESAHGPAVHRYGNAAWRKYSLLDAKGISSSCDITLSGNIYMCGYSSRCQPCAIQPPRSYMP